MNINPSINYVEIYSDSSKKIVNNLISFFNGGIGFHYDNHGKRTLLFKMIYDNF